MAASRITHHRPLVVLDTTFIVSALVFGGGLPAKVRSGWQSKNFVPLISTDTASELMRVLAYPKFNLTAADREELLADYLPFTQVVNIPKPPPAVPHCRDPLDIQFLELAVAGKAKTLVTGDKDLLAITGDTPFAIITLEAFLHTNF